MIIPSTFFIAIGLMGYGWSSQVHNPWVAPVIFFGAMSFSSSMASTTAITLLLTLTKFSLPNLWCHLILKNLLGFCFSLFNNKYADREGYRAAYVTYGEFKYLSVFCYPTLHIWQKLRRWTDEKNL